MIRKPIRDFYLLYNTGGAFVSKKVAKVLLEYCLRSGNVDTGIIKMLANYGR